MKPTTSAPWLGAIPPRWRLERAKWLFKRLQRPAGDQDEVVTCFRDGTVTLRRNRRTQGFTESLDGFGYQGIRRGDLVIHAMDAFAGAIGVSDSDGKGTGVYSVCEAVPGVEPDYYKHVLREMARSGWIFALAKGIRERSTDFRFATFAEQFLPVPPLEEQLQIAHFLDHADRRIRRAIRAKQKLIALLNEQKQAVIHRAVTRGLDPTVRLKPSGVDWLGDVPAHWDVHRLRFVAAIGTGGRDTVDRVDAGDYPFFVRSQNVERIDTYSFDGEAVLTAGDGAGVAKVFHYVDGKFDFHQRVYKFSDFRMVDGHFFYYYFSRCLQFEAFRGTAKSTVESLRRPMLADFPIVAPPSTEQREIVAWIESNTADIDDAATRVRCQIELLREYRTSLIADVVTGKLDVRDAAATLPDEADEPELPDELDVEPTDESELAELEPVEA